MPDIFETIGSLLEVGVTLAVASRLAQTYSPARIGEVIGFAVSKKRTNLAGYIVAALENDWVLPAASGVRQETIASECRRKAAISAVEKLAEKRRVEREAAGDPVEGWRLVKAALRG